MSEVNDKLAEFLKDEGYFDLKEIPNRGVCGLRRMMFTVGLFYGLDEERYNGRYCFENLTDAREAINNWDGIGDPNENWIKHKGGIEYSNPGYQHY